MKFYNKLERKFGRHAIPNLSLWLIMGYAVGYALSFVPALNGLLELCMLEPSKVMQGQVWRLFTWVITPPSYSNILFYAIMMMFYYQLGNTLERTWGTFRFNVYIFGGIFFTALGVMGSYFVLSALGDPMAYYMGYYVSTYYINLTIFLAFATCYPNMQVMLYFIIPIKMKWLAIVYVVMVAASFMASGWAVRMVILMSMMNYIIFFLQTRDYYRMSPKEVKRKREFKRQMQSESRRMAGQPYRHKCAVCGRTELDDPSLEFRFCSKCEGNQEYCQDHLFTHVHKTFS